MPRAGNISVDTGMPAYGEASGAVIPHSVPSTPLRARQQAHAIEDDDVSVLDMLQRAVVKFNAKVRMVPTRPTT